MYQIARKDKDLLEPAEQLEARLVEAGGNTVRAWNSLTQDEFSFCAREVARCLASPRYYLLNWHAIRTKRAVIRTLYPLFDSQHIVLEAYERQYEANKPIRLIVLKSRQQGITSLGVGIECWMTFLHGQMYCLAMSDEEVRVDVNYGMAAIAYDFLPWWMKPEKRYAEKGKILGFDRAKDADRKKSPGLGSLIWFESANQPSGAAYSKSLYAAHLAEIARYRNSNAITEGIFGGLVNYPRSFGLMESVARGRRGAWYRLCKAAQAGKLGWEFVFIEWFREPGYRMTVPENFVATEEEEAIKKKVKEEFNYTLDNEQLQFRREKRAEMEATDDDDEKWYQEYPLTWVEAFISSGRCAFSKKRLRDMLTHFCKPPKWRGEITLDGDNVTPRLSQQPEGRFWIWESPRKEATYFIGADPSMGVEKGNPACAECYIVPEDITQPLRQVARWHGNIAPTLFARIIAAMGYYYNTAEVAPECNTVTSVISDIVRVICYPRWYRDMREDKAKNPYMNFMGWQTSWRSKNQLISRFAEALDQWTVIIRCAEDVDEFFNYVETEEGSERYEARRGWTDDCVIATMIAYYCAVRLRPRSGGAIEEEERPVPGQDYCNTDWSPIWDKDQPSEGAITFDML